VVVVSDIRLGIATALEGMQDASGKPSISAYATTDFVVPHIRVLRIEDVNYDIAMQGGGDSYVFILQALVGDIEARATQEQLDAMIARDGAQSVKSAIEADDSLGGTVDQIWIRLCSGYRQYTVNGTIVLGCEWEAQVETSH
jgi:hypothetical protein